MTSRRTFVNITPPATTRDEEHTPPPCTDVTSWERSDWIWYDHGANDEAEALAAAKVICAPCPIRDACLAKAIANKEPGIWAATTENQRKAIARSKSGVVVGARCRRGHDLTLPDAVAHNGQCLPCRRDRRARAKKDAS